MASVSTATDLPVSERIERPARHMGINGTLVSVMHTEPFAVEVVTRNHAGVERVTLYDTARTLRGAKTIANRLARTDSRRAGLVAFQVSYTDTEGAEVVAHRAEWVKP